MNTFGLTRTFAGILIVDCCHCAQYDHIEESFQLAVQKYSFLVRPGEHIDGKEWVRRIEQRNPPQNVDHMLNAILAVMHSNPEIEHECIYY